MRPQKGISLIIVLIMLVIIALTSAAAIKNATSGEKVTNNIRLQNLAQQYAEAALRYCEGELKKPTNVGPPSGRMGSGLDEANLPLIALNAASAWELPASWTGGPGGASATLTPLPTAQINSTDSSFQPAKVPECVAEKQTLVDGNFTYVITARGFSPDYVADANGKTTNGSVVWLQSTVLLE